MIKKVFPILFMLFLILQSCVLFAGISYPKKRYIFHQVYKEGEKRPPDGAHNRLNAGAAYPQTFTMRIFKGPTINSFVNTFWPVIFVNKPYEVLHIKEMSYEWEGNAGVFLKEQRFRLSVDRYVTKDGWYWYNALVILEINFEKLFKGKEVDDEFKFNLKLVYSFDEETENTQFFEYNVEVYKGEYQYIFSGF